MIYWVRRGPGARVAEHAVIADHDPTRIVKSGDLRRAPGRGRLVGFDRHGPVHSLRTRAVPRVHLDRVLYMRLPRIGLEQ